MGTTLTGTTPQDTYDSLIKVTDNGPLSGTAKYLSDGLGNDSILALSTTAVGVGNTAPAYKLDVTGDIRTNVASGNGSLYINNSSLTSKFWTFIPETAAGETNLLFFYGGTGAGTKMTLTNGGNVGIGTAAPNFILETAGTTGIGVRSTGVDGVYTDILSSVYSGNANEQNAIQASVSGVASDSGFRFQVSNGSGLSTQTVGYQLNKDRHIFYANGTERVRVTTDGLTFNGDTAAANALDDYEEGTWTMGIAFGGASVGVTYFANTGTYTKIGRQVTVNGYVSLTSKGSSTGSASVTGLPFTIPNNNANYAAACLWINNITFANQYNAVGSKNTTTISLEEVTEAGVSSGLTNADFANNSELMVNFTYFV